MLCGSGSGGFFSLQSSVVGQVIGDHRIHSGVSWLEVAESFGYFAGPMSAGALLDAFGGVHQGAGPYLPAIVSGPELSDVDVLRDFTKSSSTSSEAPLLLRF
jgi:MFS family permease